MTTNEIKRKIATLEGEIISNEEAIALLEGANVDKKYKIAELAHQLRLVNNSANWEVLARTKARELGINRYTNNIVVDDLKVTLQYSDADVTFYKTDLL